MVTFEPLLKSANFPVLYGRSGKTQVQAQIQVGGTIATFTLCISSLSGFIRLAPPLLMSHTCAKEGIGSTYLTAMLLYR